MLGKEQDVQSKQIHDLATSRVCSYTLVCVSRSWSGSSFHRAPNSYVFVQRCFTSQGPKGAPGLRAKKCRSVGLQDKKNWGSKAPWLCARAPFSQNYYFCEGFKYRKALG